MDYNKFDNAFDLAGLQKDIEDASKGLPREKVPYGTYEVKVEKLELGETKEGRPKAVVWFRIVNGEHAKQIIFMNQRLTDGFHFHIVNTLLKQMETELPIHFESFGQYGALLEDVFSEIDGNKEFALEYGQTNKGYDTFTITKVFNL